jgi:hypothetical protein
MNVTFPAVGLLLVLVVIGVVAAKQRIGWVVLAILAGFLLAGTTLAPAIHNFLNSLSQVGHR